MPSLHKGDRRWAGSSTARPSSPSHRQGVALAARTAAGKRHPHGRSRCSVLRAADRERGRRHHRHHPRHRTRDQPRARARRHERSSCCAATFVAGQAVRAEIMRQLAARQGRMSSAAISPRWPRCAERRSCGPRATTGAARAADQQCGHGQHSPPDVGRWLRAHLRHQSSGPVPAYRLAVGSPETRRRASINVASRIHYRGRIDLAAVTDARARYVATAAYARSKLANVLHTFALARRWSGPASRQLPASGRRGHQSAAAMAARHQAAVHPGRLRCRTRRAHQPSTSRLITSVAGINGSVTSMRISFQRAAVAARE